jgi:hypothetical protein
LTCTSLFQIVHYPSPIFRRQKDREALFFIGDMLQTLSADRPELSLGVGGDRRSFSIKQATLSEFQPEYDAGNLSTPCGDKVGVTLPSRVPQDVEAGQGSRLESCASLATLLHIPSRQCALKYRCGQVSPRLREHALVLRSLTLWATPSGA